MSVLGDVRYPLTVLDDHSRFNLVLDAAAKRDGPTVQQSLTCAFGIYGLPDAMLCDNAAPWGNPDPVCPYTTFTVWLLRLGVQGWKRGHAVTCYIRRS